MSRYDGLIIPRSYSEYLNKTDSATLSQMLQHLTGLWSHAVSEGDNKPVTSDAVYGALTDAATIQQALQLPGVLSGAVAAGDNKAVKSSAVNAALANYEKITKYDGIIYNEYIDDFGLNYLTGSNVLNKHLPNLFTANVFYSLDMTAIEKDTGKYIRILYNCKRDEIASVKIKEENGLGVKTYNTYGSVVINGNTNNLIQKTKILTIVQNGTYIPL